MRLRHVLALLAVMTAAQPARADGLVAYRRADRWELAVELTRDAVVSWRDGRERLLLKTVVDRPTAGATEWVWVLPVPAPAPQIQADVLREWPTIEGVDVRAAVVQRAQHILLWSTATQLWPLVFTPVLSPRHAFPIVQQPLVPARLLQNGITQNGIRIDTLSAPSAAALAEALARLDVFLPPTALVGLDAYWGDRAAFVVYRVLALQPAQPSDEPLDALAVAIEFPSPPIGVVPLEADPARSGASVDTRLTVHGYVRAAGEVRVATTHYVGSIQAPSATKGPDPTETDQRFTELRIVPSSRWSGHALRLEPETAARIARAANWLVWSRGPVAGAVQSFLYLAVVAPLAALAVRRLWPRRARPSRRMALLLGLSHLTTLLGAIAAALLVARRLGAPRRAAFVAVAANSVLIVTLTLVLAAITGRVVQ